MRHILENFRLTAIGVAALFLFWAFVFWLALTDRCGGIPLRNQFREDES